MTRYLILICLCLAACDIPAGAYWSAQPTIAPDGSRSWAIECHDRQADCWILAGRVCPEGYTIHRENDAETTTHSNAGAARIGDAVIVRGDTTSFTGRSMLVQCKHSEQKIENPYAGSRQATPVAREYSQEGGLVRQNPFAGEDQ
jgi:hypothetical protein